MLFEAPRCTSLDEDAPPLRVAETLPPSVVASWARLASSCARAAANFATAN
jgi:hypothetical protein